MLHFKDFLNRDIENTFFNDKEFSEKVTINGKEMSVVIDEDELIKQNIAFDGKLAKGELLFYVSRSYFKHVPVPDKLMDFNGERYRIITASDNLGVLKIMLARNQG